MNVENKDDFSKVLNLLLSLKNHAPDVAVSSTHCHLSCVNLFFSQVIILYIIYNVHSCGDSKADRVQNQWP